MKILYIPLGSFCYPKIIIRETDREISESLPFDFNSSPDLSGITNILKELYYANKYEIQLNEIIDIHNGDELTVREKNMYLVHFFKTYDLVKDIKTLPVDVSYIKPEKLEEVKEKFKKRFDRLLSILNDPEHIVCFLRVENYDNHLWKEELIEFTNILSKFNNPNKFLIYSQNLLDEKLHFNVSKVLNYEYKVPILFFKHYFYDMEMINNKKLFLTILDTFEFILNNSHIVNVKKNDIIEKYYIDNEKFTIFKLTNINFFSNCYHDKTCDTLYISNAIEGNLVFKKNNDNIYIMDN